MKSDRKCGVSRLKLCSVIETRKKKPLKFSLTPHHCSETPGSVLMGPIFKCVCVCVFQSKGCIEFADNSGSRCGASP